MSSKFSHRRTRVQPKPKVCISAPPRKQPPQQTTCCPNPIAHWLQVLIEAPCGDSLLEISFDPSSPAPIRIWKGSFQAKCGAYCESSYLTCWLTCPGTGLGGWTITTFDPFVPSSTTDLYDPLVSTCNPLYLYFPNHKLCADGSLTICQGVPCVVTVTNLE